jgi:hypothetical protein
MEGVPFEAADAEYYQLPAISLHETTGFINRNVSPLALVGPYLARTLRPPSVDAIRRHGPGAQTGTPARIPPPRIEKVELRFSQPSLVLLFSSERITSAGP